MPDGGRAIAGVPLRPAPRCAKSSTLFAVLRQVSRRFLQRVIHEPPLPRHAHPTAETMDLCRYGHRGCVMTIGAAVILAIGLFAVTVE
jgi:hypothetical protein